MESNLAEYLDIAYSVNEDKEKYISGYIKFDPTLKSSYKKDLSNTCYKISQKMHEYRYKYMNEIIREKMSILNQNNSNDLRKLLVSLCILRDLLVQGWRIRIFQDIIYLGPPEMKKNTSKYVLRKSLDIERKAQLNKESVKKFINRMEKEKEIEGKKVSIKNLIGDSEVLLSKIEEYKNLKDNNCEINEEIVEPYLQLADDAKDEFTGYKLREIWRYFRYTWSIPYKNTPGRNVYYLVRDAAQPFNPVIGIAALGNTMLNLNVRDRYIGWTIENIKENMMRKYKVEKNRVMLKGNIYNSRPNEKMIYLESDYEYKERIKKYSRDVLHTLKDFIEKAIEEIRWDDLLNKDDILNPNEEIVEKLNGLAEYFRRSDLNNKRSKGEINYFEESNTNLFKKKRAGELAKLLKAKIRYKEINTDNSVEELERLLNSSDERRNITTALIANRKNKIGSNMMEIIVCGAIPPYNELLGGKLVSILTCSPKAINDYEEKYKKQISEIASRMKGEKVIRDSRLAFLGTTSLYSIGSSQYNRIKIEQDEDFNLQFKELGKTEGYGSVYFSEETTSLITKMLEIIDGGRKINNVFGEGTSPRMRLIVAGLKAIGITYSDFLKHHFYRIVYGIELAKNTKEFLTGIENDVKYYFDKDNIDNETKKLIEFWKKRWLYKRIYNVDIETRFRDFNKNSVILSKDF